MSAPARKSYTGMGCLALIIASVIALAIGIGLLVAHLVHKSELSNNVATVGNSKSLSPSDLGDGWTLKAHSAVVGCLVPPTDPSVQELTLTVNGTTYALNGTAVGDPSREMQGLSFPPPTLFVDGVADVSAYFDAAQGLC